MLVVRSELCPLIVDDAEFGDFSAAARDGEIAPALSAVVDDEDEFGNGDGNDRFPLFCFDFQKFKYKNTHAYMDYKKLYELEVELLFEI